MTALFLTLNLAIPQSAAAVDTTAKTIQILATSDTHGMFLPYDYAINAPTSNGSLAQIYTKVKELRTANPSTILVDAGDIIQSNSADIFLKDDIHPMIKAMNDMKYDAVTVGNHEFNYGVPTLQKVMAKATMPVLGGNVFEKNSDKPIFAPYTIVERDGVKIGIIGMVTQNITRWDAENLKNYKVTVPTDETKKAIKAIKDKVDVLVAVQHMSETEEYGITGSSLTALAKECPELTVIVGAHEHKAVGYANAQVSYNGIKVLENTSPATTIGKIDIKLSKVNGKYVVADKLKDVTTDLISIKGVEADKDLSAALEPFNVKAKADADQIIGTLTGGDLVPAAEIKGIPQAQVQATAMIDLINKVQMFYAKADVSAAAAFDSRANIKAGTIKKSDASLIYKYANTLYVFKMTGKQLKRYMEWSAQYYNTYKPGDLTVSFSENVRGYNYDMFNGVTYKIDITKPSGSRIVDLKKNGAAVKDTDVFRVAVNNYRANALTTVAKKVTDGPYWKQSDIPEIIEKDVAGGLAVRDLITKYIQEELKGKLTNKCENSWSLITPPWNAKDRAEAAKLINDGLLKIPTSADGRTENVKAVRKEDFAKHITLLSFNDIHGTVLEEAKGKNTGIAKFAAVIKDYKTKNPNTVVVSGGDIYQGSAVSNLTNGKVMSEFLKAIGVTASAIGNHEYDWGTGNFATWSSEGGFPFLACNIYDKATNQPVSYAKPYLVKTVNGVKIGFIGLTTPETATATKPENVKNVEFKDPAECATLWAEKLKSGSLPEGKVDIVIAVSHLGAYQDSKSGAITGEVDALTKNAKGIDAVVSGHTHQQVAGLSNGIPVVQGYYNGRSIGVIQMFFNSSNKLTSILAARDDVFTRKADIVPDATVKAIADKYETQLKPVMDKVVGKTNIELTHNSKVEDGGMTVLGTWASELMRKKVGTQICINNGGGFRAPIAKGDITMGTMYTVFPFDNAIVTMKLKGSDLKRVLENGIGNVSLGWVQVAGVSISYDLKKPFGDRITGMKLADGTTVDMNKSYTVATNDFMFNMANPAKGGDGYDFSGATDIVNTGVPQRDALVEMLMKESAVKAAAKVVTFPGLTPAA